MRFITMIFTVFLAAPLSAQNVQSCEQAFEGVGSVDPIDMTGKAYANGTVRFVVIHDGRDNEADALFIAVFSPEAGEGSRKQCHLIGREQGIGYANIALNRSDADYNAATGLTVEVPARIYLPEEGFTNTAVLSINVNQRTNTVTVTQELGNE